MSTSRHASTARELPAPDALAASHHPAASDPDLLDAFNRDAALEKWTEPEAAEAAKALWGKATETSRERGGGCFRVWTQANGDTA